jgi:hypothetical protein
MQELFEAEWMRMVDREGEPFPDQLRVDCGERKPYTTDALNNAWWWFDQGSMAMIAVVMSTPSIPYKRDLEFEEEE